jgi:hypothetical protein
MLAVNDVSELNPREPCLVQLAVEYYPRDEVPIGKSVFGSVSSTFVCSLSLCFVLRTWFLGDSKLNCRER